MQRWIRRRVRWGVLVAGPALALVLVTSGSQAQLPPLLGTAPTTTTTAPPAPATTTSTAPPASRPSGDDLTDGAAQAPAGAEDTEGDGAAAPVGGIRVPPEAQRVIDSVVRTGSNSNHDLIESLSVLQEMGLSEAEAMRVGLGRFPIAGRASYSHDWLFPRYGPGFRFHLGTDVFAAHGTPVRAPVDGIARSSNSTLGGLSVKVYMPDGTYFYLAHLSGLAEGFTDGMTVTTGDIVGFVGDSGNARGGRPHVHMSVYPRGGPPVDPKPILDGFIAEAQALLPDVVAALAEARPQPATPPTAGGLSVSEEQRVLRPTLATEAVHHLAAGGTGLPVELLYATGANPVGGPRALVQLAVDDMVAGIDWSAR